MLRCWLCCLWFATWVNGYAFAQAPARDTIAAQQSPGFEWLDLRGHDWEAEPLVRLDGAWGFAPNTLLLPNDLNHPHWTFGSATDLWKSATDSRPDAPAVHTGVYALGVIVDRDVRVPLGISIEEVQTAYEITVNGLLLGGNGQVSLEPATAVAAYAPKCYAMPGGADTLRLLVRCSNYHHHISGMTQVPVLGSLPVLMAQKSNRSILGGILIGFLLMAGVYQLMQYLHRRHEIAFLVNALWAWSAGLHFAFLHERWMYQLLGGGYWALCHKLQLGTLLLVFLASLFFLQAFFKTSYPKWLGWLASSMILLLILFTMVAPITLASHLDVTIPFVSFGMVVVWFVYLLDAYRCRREGAGEMALATVAIGLAMVSDRFLFGVHVGSLLPVHYFFSGYILMLSWILSRRAAATDRQVLVLSEHLAASNQALERQNVHLEEEVQARTTELVLVQQQAHELEMEQVRRDIEALSANNQMKLQLSRNLIGELQAILSAGGDYPHALRSMIAGLRGQVATEERLGALQDDFATVNAEFYSRLQARYPQLSKTEREICAYIKLNLSGKDIAQLRKTSINTINVARHRIRKKLGLERDEELEAVIQQV
jgi:DNA-binding CsgD family transcriptional regulator